VKHQNTNSEETIMSETGIGARMVRKEDHRFITGKGRYTDDINMPGQAFAVLCSQPLCPRRDQEGQHKGGEKADGVLCVLTGKDVADDNIGGLICGWMIHSKDGSPMKAGPHPVLAQGKVRHVGDQVAVVVARTKDQARAAAELVQVDYKVLDAVVDPRQAQKRGAPKVHDVAAKNTVFEWEIGDKGATDAAFDKAAHVTKMDIVNNRLVPNAMEPRAAIGSYDAGEDHFTLYTTSQNPHVARLVISAFIGVAPEHKLRVVAPDVGGGFGSKIFIYRRSVCTWASKKAGGRAGQVDVADRTEAS
jgi:carbon-monoxide dehydrogenase large subunit